MSDPPVDGDSLVWLWLIEYLASFPETHSLVLLQLIEQASAFPTDFAKSAREKVALRRFEALYAMTNGVPSSSEPKVTIDQSNSCEDMIRTILQELPLSDMRKGGAELLKWDIQPFIMHKNASMPKCALEQIKEMIVEGSDSFSALLAKCSGLPRNCNVQEENGHPSEEGTQRDTGRCGHKRVNDDSKKSNFLSSQGLLSKEFMAAADFSDYKKAKERASVTWKQLSAFLHEVPENLSIENSKRSSEDGTRNLRKRKGNQTNNGKDVNEGNDNQFQNGKGSVQVEAVPAHCVSNHPTSEQDPGAVLSVSRSTSESEINGRTQSCPSVRVPERHQDLDLLGPPCLGNNPSREKKDVVSGEPGLAKRVTKKDVPEKILEHKPVMPIRAVPMGGRASTNENDKAMSPNHSLILKKRKRKDQISSPRRRKVQWTEAEETKLKEGVEKFSNNGNLSWKSILEYGRAVFGDTRNPEDLRSKWKKMCKR
ncbi:unnamed protein product [Linum trigynum]|uniref:Myb-like domain-containing protein n=1 Tax=Linum trigynum TaxID=586398 RepID=A0AAV2EHJ1_9ROSI